MRNPRNRLVLTLVVGMLVVGLVALVWALGPASSRAQDGAMHNCPQAGKWAIAVWDGEDGAGAEQAFATCGQGAVAAAYSIDRETQVWSGWFAGQAKLSTLTSVDNTQGVVALGGSGTVAAPTPSPTPPATATPAGTPSPPSSPTPSPTATPGTTAVGGPPTDFLQTFHATLDGSMDLDSVEMDLGSEGDFVAPDSCSCDISATMPPLPPIEQRLIVIGNKAWIDTGSGWEETTPSDPEVAQALVMCPACPAFWEGYSLEGPLPPGEEETKNGVPAIHYSVAELHEAFAGTGLIPAELEGLYVDTFDIWLAEDGYWPVSVDMDVCADAEAMAMFTTVPNEVESACVALTIEITRVNDPTIQVNPPQ